MVMGEPGLQAHAIGAALTKSEHRATFHIQRAAHGRMIGLADQHQTLVAQGHTVEPGQLHRAIHQRRIESTGEQTFEQFTAGAGLHLQVHRRIQTVVVRQ
ncbi:hypothetical protein D3C75_1030560 [compost metagenome]